MFLGQFFNPFFNSPSNLNPTKLTTFFFLNPLRFFLQINSTIKIRYFLSYQNLMAKTIFVY